MPPARRLLHHRLDGPDGAPPLILGPSLGTSLALWEPQLTALARHYRVLRYDLPGHGASPAATLPDLRPGRTTVDDLGRLVLWILAEHHGSQTFHYAGVSLGGAIGAHLGVHHPQRLASLALVCSSARFGEPAAWHERAALVRERGTRPLLDTAPPRWFAAPATSTTLASKALLADLAGTDPAAYAACCDAVATYDLRAALPRISARTLVVAGRQDPATPPAHARELADAIPHAGLTEIDGAAHLAGIDAPARLTSALLADLGADRAERADLYDTGTTVRREVLGDAHVDRANARTTPLTAAFQDLITRYAWGEIWTRPGLDRRTAAASPSPPSSPTATTTNSPSTSGAALTNGLTPEEIGEVPGQPPVVPRVRRQHRFRDRHASSTTGRQAFAK